MVTGDSTVGQQSTESRGQEISGYRLGEEVWVDGRRGRVAVLSGTGFTSTIHVDLFQTRERVEVLANSKRVARWFNGRAI